ncbi:MAG: DUF3488 domain-containing protein [Methylococcaceae bacterium]|nr:DUF3488 domain-containing protein [Methylococcaceae bacterium]
MDNNVLENNNHTLIFLLSSIGLITLPHAWHIPLPIFAFFTLLLSWRFLGIWKPNWLPHKVIVLLLLLASIPLLLSQYRGFLGRDAGTSLFVLALSLKLLEIKKARDLYLIVYLAFIVASSQFLFEQSILMAAYILFVSCVLFSTLIIINSQQPQTLVAVKKSAIIIAQALPITIALFLLFPRVEAPRWTMFKDSNTKALTGLSDSLEPGSISDLAMSGKIAFRVKFKDDALPPSNQRYWRGPVYTYTDGKRWTASQRYSYKNYMATPTFSGKPYEYTLMLEPQTKNWVFALDMPADFSNTLSKNQVHQLTTHKNPSTRNEYNITSYPEYNTGYITKGEFRQNTQLPSAPSEKITTLINQLKDTDTPPETYINNLLKHFRTENFHYTLKPPLMEEKPIESFLFETRYGFCSHYATAFVYLMRAANIPARVVAGYQGGEFNKVGKFLEVRQANAHAWAEVWLEDKGWVRFDPTSAVAPERIEQGVDIEEQISQGTVNFTPLFENQDFSWLKETRQLWQSLDYSWQRWVIHYDTSNQSQFLAKLGIANLKAMLYWMVGIIAVIMLFLAGYLFKNNQKSLDKSLLAYQQFCRKLAKVGLARRESEGANDFAIRAGARFPEHQLTINVVTRLYNRLRYEKNPEAELLQQLQKAERGFKISIKS